MVVDVVWDETVSKTFLALLNLITTPEGLRGVSPCVVHPLT